MFPLRHPLRTPQLVEEPAARPNAAQLELSDEYIAQLLLREARDSAKVAEKYGVMSYLSGARVAPQRKEKPDAQFFQNVMRSTIGSSEYQERKRQLQQIQQDEVDYFRRKHMGVGGERETKEKDSEERKEKRSKKDKRDKKEKKSKKEKKDKHSHSTAPAPAAAAAAASKPAVHSKKCQVRGRGTRAFNPNDPDAAHSAGAYESLPVQKDDPPDVLARLRHRSDSSHSSRSHSPSPAHRARSRSRSPTPRRDRSPSPFGPKPPRRDG